MTTFGISAYAAYLPAHRLGHQAIGEALEQRAGRGSRVVAGYDEDSTTLAVEAARRAVAGRSTPADVVLATSSPAYEDKTNATAVRAALGLGHTGGAVDLVGSARSGVAAQQLGTARGGLVTLADLRSGLPGSPDERDGADAAAAFVWEEAGDIIARPVAEASASAEFLDRWRRPGDRTSRTWEERFGLEHYLPLIADAAERALAKAGGARPDTVIVSSPHQRAAKVAAGRIDGGAAPRLDGLGYSGTADAWVRLAAALDEAQAGDTILVVVAADGADAIVFEVTDAIDRRRQTTSVVDQLAAGSPISYQRYLTWRGFLDRETPRRPEPDRPGGPPAARSEAWKFGFAGSRCRACGRVHLPPSRVCSGCGAIDDIEVHPVAGREGRVTTFTVDQLAYSPSPPMTDVVVDFDGGGRYCCELTDADGHAVAIGDRVAMTFRRLYTTDGIHNYFWKARPAPGEAATRPSETTPSETTEGER